MKSFNKQELSLAVDCLYQAFYHDPIMQYFFVTEENYQKKAKRVFESWVRYCILYGICLRTDNFEAVALRKKPGDHNLKFWRIIRTGLYKNKIQLGKVGFERLMQFEKISKELQAKMPSTHYYYCWLLGTQPEFRGHGFGKQLIEKTFSLAKNDKAYVYLETANPNSLSIFLHCGYKILARQSTPDNKLSLTALYKG